MNLLICGLQNVTSSEHRQNRMHTRLFEELGNREDDDAEAYARYAAKVQRRAAKVFDGGGPVTTDTTAAGGPDDNDLQAGASAEYAANKAGGVSNHGTDGTQASRPESCGTIEPHPPPLQSRGPQRAGLPSESFAGGGFYKQRQGGF